MPYMSGDQVPRDVLENGGKIARKLQTQNPLKKTKHWVTILYY